MTNPYGEQIADYAWLRKGRKYWTVRHGNPYVTSEHRFPLNEFSRADVIKYVLAGQARERVRFCERFPHVEWEEMKP